MYLFINDGHISESIARSLVHITALCSAAAIEISVFHCLLHYTRLYTVCYNCCFNAHISFPEQLCIIVMGNTSFFSSLNHSPYTSSKAELAIQELISEEKKHAGPWYIYHTWDRLIFNFFHLRRSLFFFSSCLKYCGYMMHLHFPSAIMNFCTSKMLAPLILFMVICLLM